MFCIVCGALAGFPVLILVYADIKGEMQFGGFLAGLFVSLGFVFFGATYFIDTSELLLDDTGIRRKIFGRTRMEVPWTGIKVIREQFLKNQKYGGEIRIDILPAELRGIALRFRRTIKFSEEMESFDQLVHLLNARAEQYSIRIEVARQGIWRAESTLLTRVPT